jgi:membrane-bound lytic murein transglycosylase D
MRSNLRFSIFLIAATLATGLLTSCSVKDWPAFLGLIDHEHTAPTETTQITSIWPSITQHYQMPDIKTPIVAQQARLYASGVQHFQTVLDNARPYLYFVVQELKRRNMPVELAFLPIIESSYSPRLQSGLNPAGLWGLMPVAAKHLDLVRDEFKDERRDIIRSTQAALDLLQELHKQFGDWNLALAAYNWGPGNVSRALSSNTRRKVTSTYDMLAMPRETQVFVPKLFALRDIIARPEAYQITLPEIPDAPYFEIVPVAHTIDIKVAAELADMSVHDFINLNPAYNKPVIVGSPNQTILLPIDHAKKFRANLNLRKEPLSEFTSILLVTPETPESLARIWNVDAARLRQINQKRWGERLKVGTIILLPIPSGQRL